MSESACEVVSGAQAGCVEWLGLWQSDYDGPPEVVLGFERTNECAECAVGWLNADGPTAFGHLTLWETGDIVAELYDLRTADLLVRRPGQVHTFAELLCHLSYFLAGFRRTPEWCSQARTSDPRSLPLADTGPVRRRLHF